MCEETEGSYLCLLVQHLHRSWKEKEARQFTTMLFSENFPAMRGLFWLCGQWFLSMSA